MLTIRTYRPEDLPRLRELTIICFEGVSIDHNIEKRFGRFGVGWEARKAAHIDDDCAADPEGVFVAEVDGEVAGYITSRLNRDSLIGWIPNLSVDPKYRRQGIARALFERAFTYFRDNGMRAAKIETLEQNAIGGAFYPQLGFEEVARQIHYVKPLGEE